MAGRGRARGSNGRQERERGKWLEAALGAMVFGFALLVLPALTSNPVLRGLGAASSFAWLLIGGGVVLLLLHRLTGKSAAPELEQPPTERRFGSKPQPAAAPRHEPLGDPVVDDVLQRAAQSSREAVLPVAPTSWSAAVFDVIEWRRFEAVCEWLFAQAGFETKTQSHGADGGIDIWLYSKHHPEGPMSVVQCKHWKRPVKVAEMRALLGSMTDKKVRRGIFATTSTFTDDARRLANDNAIHLLDRDGLLELIAKRSPEQQQELLAVATKGEFWKPTCASCGVKMVWRDKTRNGRQFWGCVNFPKCRNVMS